MKFIIHSEEFELDRNFAVWLFSHIKRNILKKMSSGKIRKWDSILFELFSVKISASRCINLAIQFMTVKVDNGDVIYELPKHIQHTSGKNLCELCKLIDVGTLEFNGLNIFHSVFSEIQSNLKDYIQLYIDSRRR